MVDQGVLCPGLLGLVDLHVASLPAVLQVVVCLGVLWAVCHLVVLHPGVRARCLMARHLG